MKLPSPTLVRACSQRYLFVSVNGQGICLQAMGSTEGMRNCWDRLTVFGALELYIELANVVLNQIYFPVAHHPAARESIRLIDRKAALLLAPTTADTSISTAAAGVTLLCTALFCTYSFITSISRLFDGLAMAPVPCQGESFRASKTSNTLSPRQISERTSK